MCDRYTRHIRHKIAHRLQRAEISVILHHNGACRAFVLNSARTIEIKLRSFIACRQPAADPHGYPVGSQL